MYPAKPLKERIQQSIIIDHSTGCWLWQKALSVAGRGVIGVNKTAKLAHLVSYEAYNGELQLGTKLQHKCPNLHCVNPDHLEAVPSEKLRQQVFTSREIIARENGARAIPITGGKFALVDNEDYENIARNNWSLSPIGRRSKTHYARRVVRPNGKNQVVLMHRQILSCAPVEQVDHINGDGLDNRRKNLRIVHPCENQWNRGKSILNTTGYRGVYFEQGKYVARITAHGKKHYLGRFLTAEEAGKAYDARAKRLHGEFAFCNRS